MDVKEQFVQQWRHVPSVAYDLETDPSFDLSEHRTSQHEVLITIDDVDIETNL